MPAIHPLYTWWGDWSTLRRRLAAVGAGDIVVLNPSNGPTPDDIAEQTGVATIARTVTNLGALPFGYVHLDYGRRPLGAVLDDIREWSVTFGVKRIFFDETPADWAGRHLGLLWGAVRGYAGSGADPIVVFNPGAPMPANIAVPSRALVVTFEGAAADFPRRNWQPWEAAIVYASPVASPIAGGPAWQYVTNDVLPNPFDGV